MKRRRFLSLMGGAAVVAPFIPSPARAEAVTIPDGSIGPLESYADETGARGFLVPYDGFYEGGYRDTIASGLVKRARSREELLAAQLVLKERTAKLFASVNGVTWHPKVSNNELLARITEEFKAAGLIQQEKT